MHRLLIVLLAFTVACGSATSPAHTVIAPLPNHTATALLTPTMIPAATSEPTATLAPTVAPTPTPYPPLQTDGPYLAYLKQQGEQQALVLLDADGAGRKVLELPIGAYVENLESALSPDGKWLAFHYSATPKVTWQTGLDIPTLELRLLNLEDGSVKTVARLAPPNFPENFEKLADWLDTQVLSDKPERSLIIEALQQSFHAGITALEWSADGRQLAFAGAMDGPSSDLYVYDPVIHSVQRLTDGLGNIQWLSWSPNGQWILHGSQAEVGQGIFPNFYAVKADGSVVNSLDFNGSFSQWLGETTALVYSAANGPGAFGLVLVDISSSQKTEIWSPPFTDFDFDPENKIFVISTFGDGVWTDAGVYQISISTGETRKVAELEYAPITYWPNEQRRFLLSDSESSLWLFADGSTQPEPRLHSWFSLSPNGAWLITQENERVQLQAASLAGPINEFDLTGSVTWLPDSSGFYVFSTDEAKLTYVAIQDLSFRVVENQLAFDEDILTRSFSTVWVRR